MCCKNSETLEWRYLIVRKHGKETLIPIILYEVEAGTIINLNIWKTYIIKI